METSVGQRFHTKACTAGIIEDKEMYEKHPALQIECRVCGAAPGVVCTDRRWKRYTPNKFPHIMRQRDWSEKKRYNQTIAEEVNK